MRGLREGGLSASALKILAMGLMLCDHLWATLLPGAVWLSTLGRMAFPIFAFQVAEGYAHTKNFKGYLGRMFLFALVSEIPFDLMYGGTVFYPFHQNVIFTFCLALVLLRLLDQVKERPWPIRAVVTVAAAVIGYLLGMVTMVDYYGYGVLTVLVFYLCRSLRWGWAGEAVGLAVINIWMIKGMLIPVTILGLTLELPQQGAALFSLIPIWLYNGEEGRFSRSIRLLCYLFYPLHILILALLWLRAV